jgi:hypothetical protein
MFDQKGPTTLSITTLSIATHSITQYKTQHSAWWQSVVIMGVIYAECADKPFMLGIVMLSVVEPNCI